jgi:hypothetical protein
VFAAVAPYTPTPYPQIPYPSSVHAYVPRLYRTKAAQQCCCLPQHGCTTMSLPAMSRPWRFETQVLGWLPGVGWRATLYRDGHVDGLRVSRWHLHYAKETWHMQGGERGAEECYIYDIQYHYRRRCLPRHSSATAPLPAASRPCAVSPSTVLRRGCANGLDLSSRGSGW